MKKIKKGIAVLLCLAMCIPGIPGPAKAQAADIGDAVKFNTGNYEYCVVDENKMDELYKDYEASIDTDAEAELQKELKHYVCYDAEGNYKIPVEKDAFFPYEVQFVYGGETESRWFQTALDTVVIGGHTFSLDTSFSGDVVTQMSLQVGEDTVVVYPKKKEFQNDENSLMQPSSLLPLEERELTVDLTGYTPVELTKVSFNTVFAGENKLPQQASVMWKQAFTDDDYQYGTKEGSIGSSFDLSVETYYGDSTTWEMIIGEKDQLAPYNIRYIIEAEHQASRNWLVPVIGKDQGARQQMAVSYSNYDDDRADNRYILIDFDGTVEGDYFISLNAPVLSNKNVKVYEGQYTEGAPQPADITAKILNADMSAVGSGYPIVFDDTNHKDQWITFVTYDAGGGITGCLPVRLSIYKDTYTGITISQLKDGQNNYPGIVYGRDWQNIDGVSEITHYLYKEYPVNGTYIQCMDYLKDGKEDNTSAELAAFLGAYASISEAQNAGAQDVKTQLFGDGYTADYSAGVTFSVFVGADGEQQKKYCYRIKTLASDHSVYDRAPSSSTYVDIQGVAAFGQPDSVPVSAYVTDFDSYGDNNYYMILADSMVNGTQVDLKNLALLFETGQNVSLYGEGASAPEESGKGFRDFTGLVQFTASSEDKKYQQNYFVQVIKAEEGKKLCINSLNDAAANTHVENGVICSSREMMLDTYHDDRHDIIVANMGTQTMSALQVNLESDYLELDEYWTLSGKHDLSPFTSVERDTLYGALANMAKIRLKQKAGVEHGTYENLGTLTFVSQGQQMLVLTLTGVIGNPCITTKQIKNPTKYVPYGTMIMNSNKYDWNKVTYELAGGKLPAGMELMENGELYGVPKEAGDFEISVRMKNSHIGFPDDRKTFKFSVLENTDTNVDNAEDEGYKLTKRIAGIYDTTADGGYLIISEGVFDQYTDLYIDGEKLTRGTDYEAESGSTHITIASQSLKKSAGTHTIGVEFQRNKNKGEVKAAAQNYVVKSGGSSNNSSGSSSSGGSWGGGGTVTRPVSKPNNSADQKPADTKPPVSKPSQDQTKPVQEQDTSDGENTTLSKAMLYARSYAVQKGDTLKSIAKKYYGKSDKWKKIFDANKGKIPVSMKLKKGQKLVIPAINYTVKKGDTVKSIAKKYFGANSKWRQVYQVNKDVIPSSLKIKPGQKLVIPVPVVCTIYMVKKGDNLEKISKKFYGTSEKWKKIYNANKNKISASKKVKAGKKLFIPAMTCTVKKGDDLKSLAKKYYGTKTEWRRIYEANKDIVPTSKKLKKGSSLVIPVPVDIG